jgi:hypothetical protein
MAIIKTSRFILPRERVALYFESRTKRITLRGKMQLPVMLQQAVHAANIGIKE